jgi:two-component system, NtrC family, sensor histidine kinase PilS
MTTTVAPQSDPRMLIAIRVVVITSLVLAALIIQFTAPLEILLPINYLYLVAGVCYALTIAYIAVVRLVDNVAVNYYVQFAGDVFIITMLVYFTGGLDSPFSFLYLVTIITSSMILYRKGGLVTASGSVILYAGLVDLMYYGFLPPPPQSFFSSPQWSSVRLYLNLATNIAGFYATALLTSYVSEKLRRTSEELTVNRQNLAELKALNENVIASIPSGLLTIGIDGRITFINPAGCEILACRPDETVGKSLSDLALLKKGTFETAATRLGDERVVRGEIDTPIATGETVRLGYSLSRLFSLEGEPSGFTYIFQDLTEMKKLEAELRMKDRMAAVGELSAGIAHEIRNPLAAIAGSVQVLSRSATASTQEQRLMSIVLKESERLNKTIADFLRFVKPHEKREADFDISASLIETLELLSNSPEVGEQKSIRWTVDPSSFFFKGDQDQIKQVFWNLARNALQAMSGGGVLEVFAVAEKQHYRIRFSDEGKGMTDAERRAMFQPFRTSFPSGTGLGMAISYRIIQEHHGSIEVESVPGQGTSILVVLPIGAKGRREALAEVTARGVGKPEARSQKAEEKAKPEA